MATQHLSATCPSCSFPIAGRPGQVTTCPNCGISGRITGVEIPGPIFWGGLGILVGLVLAKSKYVAAKLARL